MTLLMMFSKSRGAQTVAITVAERVAANNPDFTWGKNNQMWCWVIFLSMILILLNDDGYIHVYNGAAGNDGVDVENDADVDIGDVVDTHLL